MSHSANKEGGCVTSMWLAALSRVLNQVDRWFGHIKS